jgi:predicted Fe-S protein YdhL (DUF1289 family)
MSLPPVHVPSPCINVCQMDPQSGLCQGCRRTLQEIAEWMEMTPREKLATLERVAERGLSVRDANR